MITAETLRFLSDLKRNNERAWFLAHKDRYLEAKAGFQEAVAELIGRIPAFDKVSHAHAGYYLHLEPGNCFLGGGAYHPMPEWLKAIRGAIDRDGGELKRILASASFRKYFGKMEGEALKIAPQGYPTDHLYIEYLRHKSFLAVHRLRDGEMAAGAFPAHAGKVFRALQPFARFFNEASEEA